MIIGISMLFYLSNLIYFDLLNTLNLFSIIACH